ncbi:MAG TPA: calcium-binding protein, partial [Crinalium sp.]
DRLIITDPSMTSVNVIVTNNGGEFPPADFLLTFHGAVGSIRLYSQLYGYYGIEQVTFGDGVTWDEIALQNAYLRQAATDGNDTIYGFNTNDTLAGGLGNDVLYGGDGGDVYLYARGDGNDFISDIVGNLEAGDDRLILSGEGLTSQNLVIQRAEYNVDNVQLTFKGIDGVITLADQAVTDGVGIEKVRFSDGVVFDRLKLQRFYLERSATKDSDEIYGFYTDDLMRGAGGNDVLFGERGSDTYIYNKGDGNDTIIDRSDLNGEIDRLVISSSAGLTSAKARVKRTDGSDELELSFTGTKGKFVLYGQGFTEEDTYQKNLGLEEVKFSDGVIWNRKTIQTTYLQQAGTSGNDNIIGFSSADLIVGGLGDDTLAGGQGADTFRYAMGDGRDRITDFQHGVDTLQLIASSHSYQLVDLLATSQVLVDFGSGQGILVDNISKTQLASDIVLTTV